MVITQFDWREEETFMGLWTEYITDLSENGSEILPTPRTLETYRQIFLAYVTGRVPGVVVGNAERQGVTMWGASLQRGGFDTKYGVMGHSWGTYVQPEARGQGLSGFLQQAAKEALVGSGIDALYGSASIHNPAGKHTALKVGGEIIAETTLIRVKE